MGSAAPRNISRTSRPDEEIGHAYFGSWGLSHAIPTDVLQAIRECEYVWIFHGRPDHLSFDSLDLLSPQKWLLPDHVGGRIRDGLRERGLDVAVLRDCRWYQLSDKLRVLSIADYNQDAILLVDIGGTLIFNLNDASDPGLGSGSRCERPVLVIGTRQIDYSESMSTRRADSSPLRRVPRSRP
jgi:hypothetical protein